MREPATDSGTLRPRSRRCSVLSTQVVGGLKPSVPAAFSATSPAAVARLGYRRLARARASGESAVSPCCSSVALPLWRSLGWRSVSISPGTSPGRPAATQPTTTSEQAGSYSGRRAATQGQCSNCQTATRRPAVPVAPGHRRPRPLHRDVHGPSAPASTTTPSSTAIPMATFRLPAAQLPAALGTEKIAQCWKGNEDQAGR